MEFQVITHGLNWQVGRRYSDFIWLREYLTKFYPTQIIPPIPNKKAAKISPRHLNKRMKILSFFLNDIVHKQELFNCKYVEAFLSVKDSEKFESIKKEGENKKSYESIASTETASGVLKV